MIMQSKNCTLSLAEETGSILSYRIYEREFCAPGGDKRPLFTIKFLDKAGNYVYHSSLEAQSITIENIADGYTINFNTIAGLQLAASVTVTIDSSEYCHWHISLDNNTDCFMEWVEFPQICVPDNLKAEGGDSELFWPVVEGMIVDDKSVRARCCKYAEIGGQMGTWNGFYPRSCPMQFMAYYNEYCGLYFGAHDRESKPKTVEWREEMDGIALEYRLFTDGAVGHVDAGYDMITAPFVGGWMDAAEIYRSWAEKEMSRPTKLWEREDLPEWIDESPVVLIYPIRGSHDTGKMETNLYYPYANMLPIAARYAAETDSKVMPLLMHWEGTAPWATPYVWPPFGGAEEFREFVDALHAQGNLAGVYCSGIGWTTYSYLNPKLDFSDRYDEELICRTPEGKIEQSKTIGPPIRDGYDMCPFNSKVDEIVSSEVLKIASSGVDYAQYFDQNLGGNASFCYARDHGHPMGPGKWMTDAMLRIIDKTTEDLKKMGSDMVLGCEGAAAEPFIGVLPINDLRFNVSFYFGKPVPAYAYVFHEYINNFMGNQVTTYKTMDLAKNPHCLLFRLAYSFVAGDMLALILAEEGKASWGWGVPWDTFYPNQENVLTLVKNVNYWRRERKEYIRYGKMIKEKPLSGVGNYVLYHKMGWKFEYPSLLSTRWKNPAGKEAQVVVNFLPETQTFSVETGRVYTIEYPDGIAVTGNIDIAPLSAVWID